MTLYKFYLWLNIHFQLFFPLIFVKVFPLLGLAKRNPLFISFSLFTHLNLATVAAVALRAATLVAANVIDALAAILTRIRFAFIILEVAQVAGESCEEHKSEGGGKQVKRLRVM